MRVPSFENNGKISEELHAKLVLELHVVTK